jgi:hypothetical protein
MGYALCFGYCFGCHKQFAFNPMRVPSIRDPKTGSKEPICWDCVEKANPRRVANGLEPIVPHPEAYAPINEEELP